MMHNLQNSYVNHGGYAGNLLLATAFAALAIFCLGGSAFSDDDVRFVLLRMSAAAAILFGISASMWWNARARYIEESGGYAD